MSILQQIKTHISVLKQANKKPTSVNLSVEEAFQLLEEVTDSNPVATSLEMTSLLITRDVTEMIKHYQNATVFGLQINVYLLVNSNGWRKG
tara:strand:- start:37639 stop:37911 length:273 start_codon:yes stop_codon:yes gene_type:complete